MAVVINKRAHQLRQGALVLVPGENHVSDEHWSEANIPGSQAAVWQSLNWLSVRRSLPIAPPAAASAPELVDDRAAASAAPPAALSGDADQGTDETKRSRRK